MVTKVHYNCASDVYDDGLNYVYNMMLDYEKVIVEHEPLTLDQFLKDWNVIPRSAFSKLDIGDIVYDCIGTQYIICEEPWEDDQSDAYIINGNATRSDGTVDKTLECTFSSGDLYYTPYYHNWAFFKPKKQKGDSKICPILITSLAQPQS